MRTHNEHTLHKLTIMSTVPISRFRAKDGLYYNSYMEQRAANMRQNEAALKAAGLDAASFRAAAASVRRSSGAASTTTTTTTPKKQRLSASRRAAAVVTPTPPRRLSVRVRNLPPSDPGILPQERFSPSPKRRKIQKKQQVVDKLTEEERTQLREQVDWLDEMEAYLKDEENLSYQNYRSVMRQVEKLVAGEGVTYHHWDEGTYFYKDSRITLSDDFDVLYEEACNFEDEHGKDLGNGTCVT